MLWAHRMSVEPSYHIRGPVLFHRPPSACIILCYVIPRFKFQPPYLPMAIQIYLDFHTLYESLLIFFNIILRYSSSAFSTVHFPTKCPAQLWTDRYQSERVLYSTTVTFLIGRSPSRLAHHRKDPGKYQYFHLLMFLSPWKKHEFLEGKNSI